MQGFIEEQIKVVRDESKFLPKEMAVMAGFVIWENLKGLGNGE